MKKNLPNYVNTKGIIKLIVKKVMKNKLVCSDATLMSKYGHRFMVGESHQVKHS